MRKILSIDGGGIKGVFPASFLATIEDTIGDDVWQYFDLIVGTSTGGIIALALGLGMSAKDILAFYEKLGPAVFGGNTLVRRLRQWGIAKYDREPLAKAVQETFGGKQLADSKTRLVIPSLNLETGEVYIFKTSHIPHLQRDFKERMATVALATAAAPVFFPTYRSASGIPLVDGGMWANNPSGMAAVEAVGYLKWPCDEIKLLSIGCTTEPLHIRWIDRASPGLMNWARGIVDVFMKAQASASHGTAQILVGHDNVYRFSPTVGKGRFALDSIRGIQALRGLGDDEARKALRTVREVFFTEHAEPFVPCHTR